MYRELSLFYEINKERRKAMTYERPVLEVESFESFESFELEAKSFTRCMSTSFVDDEE